MKRIAFLLAASLCAPAYAVPAGRSANGQLDQILSNMQQASRNVRTMQAKLLYRKRNTEIGGQERNTGYIKFKHGGPTTDQLRIQYDNGVVVVVDGNRIELYQPSINQLTKYTRASFAKGNRELSLLETPYSSISVLKERFNITHRGDETVNSRPTSVIDLVPKSQSSAKKLTLWVDHSIWLPIQYEVVERAATTTFIISDLQTNGDLGRNPFKIDVAKGTKFVTP